MTESIQKAYDDVPYNDDPIRATNITHLATVGRLFGLNSPDPERARILELGCAKGGNLLSIAYQLPHSSCLGIDISGKQIEAGRAVADAAGIKNLELRNASILDVTGAWGQFDYIIAHGILSWVPKEVQQKIWSIFSTNLSQNGIGYVSYNTYPGWNIRGALREYMLVESRRHTSNADKVRAAREILNFLSEMPRRG